MRYIQRQSSFARGLHWIHTIACLSLFVTGIMLFVPGIASSLGVSTMNGARFVHRVAAVVFIAAPILGIVVNPKGFSHFMKNMFYKWDAQDWEFMKKFFPYLLLGKAKTAHMPPQKELKSGQAFSDWLILGFAILISISGVFLWLGSSMVGEVAIRWMLLLHDGMFILLGVMMLAHVYLGAGVFQPYRGSIKLMFGDGKINESDALYHWGTWAIEELKKGDNVTTE